MNPTNCLPPELRGPATTITPLTAGLSGAGVYRVDTSTASFVLKLASDSEPAADWHRTLTAQRLAADAGLTPRIVHVDESRRAVVTAFVADRSFATWYRDPRTHHAALAALARTVRGVHALPLSLDAPRRDPREFLSQIAGGPLADFALPPFARDAIARALADDGAPPDRLVLGHNDLNPGNLVFDGESVLLLDWAATGAADAAYDLATLAVFLRMNDDDCERLLAAYDDHAAATRFTSHRRLVAALAGTMQLYVARQMQHPGATGDEALATTLGLADFYAQMRTGALRLGTPDGQWVFGLALLKESLAVV